jgi:nucleoside-diphosphate-sugar epimerase
MKVALTGGTGFLGRHFIRRLLLAGHQVVAWHRSDPPTDAEYSTVDWIRGELGNAEDAERLVATADAVIHSGLYRQGDSFMAPPADPVDYWQRNTTGSLLLLEAARRRGVAKFLFVSSGAVHDNVLPDRPLDETHPRLPSTLYGAYKASVETLIHHYGSGGGLLTAAIRPTAIYGLAQPPQHSKWFDLVRDICNGRDVQATGGSKSVHAEDVAKTALLLLDRLDESNSGQPFNCCERMISDHEVATIAKELTGSRSEIHGHAKQARHQIVTDRIESLGMRFGGEPLLRETIAELIDAARG